MDGGKPLIFIKPYSKTLEKLVEVLKESSEDQGTEIYEIEDVKEAIQIIPQLGQSLIIAAHPRKTAQILQTAGKLIRKIQSKVLLLTPKPIPRKTIDKFMKVGLTECIIEPIAPKTLQYKVNLLLRSIVIKKEEGDYEQNFDSNNDQNNDDELARKQLNANIKEEDKKEEVDGSDLYATEDKTEKKKSTYKEESIAGYYKGAAKKKEDSINEEEDDADKNNSEIIEGYYKNKVAKREDEEAIKEENKQKKKELDEDEFDELSKSASLLLEDDEDQVEENSAQEVAPKEKKKAATVLDLEEEKIKKEIQKDLQKEDDADDIVSHHLDLINDLEEINDDAAPEHEKAISAKKTATILDLEDELPEAKEDAANLEKEVSAKKTKAKLDIEDEELEVEEVSTPKDDLLKKEAKTTQKLKLEEDENLNDEPEDIADQLEALNQASKASLELEDDDEVAKEEASEKEKNIQEKKKVAAINLEEDPKPKDEKKKALEEEPIYGKKKAKHLALETEQDLDYGRKKREEKQKHQVEREIQEREENKRKAERENQGYTEREMNNKSSGYTENIQDQGGNKADVHSDKLKTHYDSRTGLKHNDEEWREVERERRADEEFKAEKKNEFAMPEKTDWGEQTIDYSDLKKQFEETGYSLGTKKEVGQFEDGQTSSTGIKYTQAVGANFVSEEEAELEEIATESQEEENPIFEADLKSSLTLIKSLNIYYQYSKSRDDTVKSILEMVRNDFGALAAIKYGKGPKDGKLKLETIGNWLDDASKDSIINTYTDAASCPILPSYSDKTFEQKRTMFFYPFTEGITTFAWVQCFLPNGIKEAELKGLEASLETMRGALLDEFYELGGTGPYAEIKKKAKEKDQSSSSVAKIGSFFGGLFGKKKAG